MAETADTKARLGDRLEQRGPGLQAEAGGLTL